MSTGDMTCWTCEKCGCVVWADKYHVCPQGSPAQPVACTATYQPDYQAILERIEQSLLRIEKLLEKEL